MAFLGKMLVQKSSRAYQDSSYRIKYLFQVINARRGETAESQCLLCRINLRHDFAEQEQQKSQYHSQYQELCQRRMKYKDIHKEEVAEHDNGYVHKIISNQYRRQETFGIAKKGTYFIIGSMIPFINIIPV
ncbi:unknown [Bacteroides sp. CAG:754]|nr:unknown [Bacteroides sp. CAG:754]